MDCSTPGFPVLHYLPEFAQTHVHGVNNAIQPSYPFQPLLLLLSDFSSINVFSNELAVHIRWLQGSWGSIKVVSLEGRWKKTLGIFQNSYFPFHLLEAEGIFSMIFRMKTWWGSWIENTNVWELHKTKLPGVLTLKLDPTKLEAVYQSELFFPNFSLTPPISTSSKLWFYLFPCLSRFEGGSVCLWS